MGNEVIEKKLRKLFDFQRFMKEPELDKVINETAGSLHNMIQLGDYDLDMVAAGADAAMTAESKTACPLCGESKGQTVQDDGMMKCGTCGHSYMP